MKRGLLVLALLLATLVPAAHAAAYDPFGAFKGTDCSGDAKSSALCSTNGKDNVTGTTGILRKVTALIALLAGVAAVILIIISGIEFVTSGGDSNKVATARSALIGAIVGVVIVAFAQAMLEFVLKGV